MTAGRHNLSRRAVLGACFGVPAWLGGPAPAEPFALMNRSPCPRHGCGCPGDIRTCSLSKGSPSPPSPQERNGLRQAQPERSGCDQPVGNRWTRALAGFRRAGARLAAFQAEIALLPPEARAWPAAIPLDDRFDRLECARLAALRRLLRAPAPDLAALSLKLDLALADRAWELAGATPCLAALQADARRLAQSLQSGSVSSLELSGTG